MESETGAPGEDGGVSSERPIWVDAPASLAMSFPMDKWLEVLHPRALGQVRLEDRRGQGDHHARKDLRRVRSPQPQLATGTQ